MRKWRSPFRLHPPTDAAMRGRARLAAPTAWADRVSQAGAERDCSQPAAPRAHLHSPARKRASISCSFCCRPQVQRRGVGKHYMGRSMTARREARQGARSDQPRACSSRPYTGTELAARCTTRCCLLLLPAGLFDVDDLSDVASLIASLTSDHPSDPASDLLFDH